VTRRAAKKPHLPSIATGVCPSHTRYLFSDEEPRVIIPSLTANRTLTIKAASARAVAPSEPAGTRLRCRRIGRGRRGHTPPPNNQRQQGHEREDQGDRRDDQCGDCRALRPYSDVSQENRAAKNAIAQLEKEPRRSARTPRALQCVLRQFARSAARIIAPERRCRFALRLTASEQRQEKPSRERDTNRGEGIFPHGGAQIIRRLGQVLIAGEKFAAPAVEV